MGIENLSIRVRCYPYERMLVDKLCADRHCTISDLLRMLVKQEYKRAYGDLPRSSARDQIRINGHPPKGGHPDEAFERALKAKNG